MQITKSAVDKLTNGFLWDDQLKGFGVRSEGKGKHYVLKYRVGKRQRWITIGRHGSPWCPATARTEAKRLLGLIAQGRDPAVERDREKSTVTVKELAGKFLEHVKARRKGSTWDTYARVIDKHVVPTLGKFRTSDLASADIARLHDGMSGTPSQANLVYRVLHAMFAFAEKRGIVPKGSNPCHGAVEKYEELPRERYLSPDEFKRLGQALDQHREEYPFAVHAIGLLALTGARKNEILTLKWDYVDTNQGLLRLPDSKTGAKLIYLNDAAMALLSTIPRIEGNPYVIPGRDNGCLKSISKVWERIRTAAGLPDVHLHDLRHSLASVAAGKGISLLQIGGLLGHKDLKSTRRYAHLAAAPMLAVSDTVGSEIANLMSPEKISQKAA